MSNIGKSGIPEFYSGSINRYRRRDRAGALMATATMPRLKPFNPQANKPPTALGNMDKFIWGLVNKLIRTYSISDFIFEGRGSDYRDDMYQTAYCAVLSAQRRHSKKAKNPAYLKTCIVNSLLKDEQGQRKRRQQTENSVDELVGDSDCLAHTTAALTADDTSAQLEAQQDVEKLFNRANLTDSERTVVELSYGFGRGADIGPQNVEQTMRLVGKSNSWVSSRLQAAHIKLSVASEPDNQPTSPRTDETLLIDKR